MKNRFIRNFLALAIMVLLLCSLSATAFADAEPEFRLAAKHSAVPSAVHPSKDIPSDMPYYQAANKTAAVLCGMPAGYAREPMENIPEEELPELREILRQMGCNVVC